MQVTGEILGLDVLDPALVHLTRPDPLLRVDNFVVGKHLDGNETRDAVDETEADANRLPAAHVRVGVVVRVVPHVRGIGEVGLEAVAALPHAGVVVLGGLEVGGVDDFLRRDSPRRKRP